MGCDVLSIPRAVGGLKCCCGHCFACFELPFPFWLRVLSNWSDQLSGFYIFPQPDRAIVNCFIFSWSFYPEQLNFVVQAESEEIVEEKRKYEKSLFSTTLLLAKLK